MSFEEAVRKAIQERAEVIASEEAAEASKRIEKRIRMASLEIAVTVGRMVSMHYGEKEVLIRIDTKDLDFK